MNSTSGIDDATGPETLPDDDVVYQINTFGADFTVDGLVIRFDRGDIFRPEFQRNYVWSLPQASKFIESILLGLPIPSVFLYREETTQQHLIVDGLQRLTTLHSFSKGRFPRTDKVFRLKDVKPRFEGRSLDELEIEDQRRFQDSVVHAMIIQQSSPTGDTSSVFHIFERLNSNGTPLEPQEMRAAIYHGPFQRLLFELNQSETWREIFGPVHRRSKDEELILRFFAFLYDRESYVSPMKLFLNTFMEKNRNLSLVGADNLEVSFLETLNRIHAAIGNRAFRMVRTLNAAIYDSFMVAVAKNPSIGPNAIKKAYLQLLNNAEYVALVSKATANEQNVDGRMKLAESTLRAAS